MKYLPALAAVCLLIVPSVVHSQQISPNPNPAGNVIRIDSSGAFNDLDFKNHGEIWLNQNTDSSLTNKAGATITCDHKTDSSIEIWGGAFFNFGTLTLNGSEESEDESELQMYGGTFENHGALHNQGDFSAMGNVLLSNETSGTWINGGTVDVVATEAGSGLGNYGQITNNKFFSAKQFLNTGGINNKGEFFVESMINAGDITNEAKSRFQFFQGTNDNIGSVANHGTLMVDKNVTLTNESNGTITNNGFFEITSGYGNFAHGVLVNHGSLVNDGRLANNGLLDNSNGSFANNGSLEGSGTIKGNYTDHGQTKPGNSAGVMTIDGDYFKVEGSKEIELGGLFDGGGDKSLTEHDWVDVTGNVELAGTLDVSLIDGFELHRGNVFNFLRVGGTLSGQYDDLGEGDLVGNFGGQDLFITYGGGDGNDVALFTNAVPEPTTVLIWSMLAGVGMTVRRRR